MKIKQKSWVWKLTWPFAHSNFTTINGIIYYPKDILPNKVVIKHEEIHMKQQQEVGLVKFLLLYLLALPLFYNPWRYKWEYEAYTKGSGYSAELAKAKLKTKTYGWLIN